MYEDVFNRFIKLCPDRQKDLLTYMDYLISMSDEENSMSLSFIADVVGNRGKNYTYYFCKSY